MSAVHAFQVLPVLRVVLSGRPVVSAPRVSRLVALLRQKRPMRIIAGAGLVAMLGFGGCAQSPQQIAAQSHGKEYFSEAVYGRASRRVVADGQPIPHGGGQYLVGKPYTVAGQTYYPSERRVVQVGNASWYGDAFHGRLTANGEVYDRDGFTAAHPTMPLPSYARVTNLRNNASMIVRVNDRGPYHSNRVMDVSRRVAEALDFKRYGTAKVKIEYVGRASLAGSDDARLLATLRTDGPARWDGEPGEPTMVAEAAPPPPRRVAALESYAPAPRFVERDEEAAPPPPRRRVAIAPPPRPEPRFVERPEAVTAAYQRFGRVQEVRRPIAESSSYRRYAEAETDRYPVAQPTRTAYRDTPHLPLRDLLPPPRQQMRQEGRQDRGYDAPIPPSRRQASLPPARPLDLGTIPGADSEIHARRRVAALRAPRYRDDE